ncbi:SprT family protein [Staphylococcus sp. SQ8-PEA]|uniref:Protein SprT-like n=1 Tax=Staphylococcus marylandisciuri TaxID=2981529 RepID=A0ABT2QRC7_9STAP|nr:SprT family protein [Staphylococcus marylandisciuri]MCU5746535.1 SprT family protein [Staphylococcus marylandisciuri]
MNDQDLQLLTERISEEYFDSKFSHQAYFNNRLRTTGGRYMLKSHHIEINPKQYEHYGEQALKDIIKHELCHYHLHLKGKGYQHRDKAFKELSSRVGAPRYCTPIQSYEERVNYIYRCKNCGHLYRRIRKVNLRQRVCGHCRGNLLLLKKYK